MSEEQIDRVAADTGRPFGEGGAYSSDCFEDWRGCVALLFGEGLSEEDCVTFLRSKNMRWCSDGSPGEYGHATVADLKDYVGKLNQKYRAEWGFPVAPTVTPPESKPPTLPGEVWRGEDGDGDPVCVVLTKHGHRPMWWEFYDERGSWCRCADAGYACDIMSLWASDALARCTAALAAADVSERMAKGEREERERLEKVAAAERALRKAEAEESAAFDRVQAIAEDEAMGRDVFPEAAGQALVAAEQEVSRCEATLVALGVTP
jgi:hypothetical protein